MAQRLDGVHPSLRVARSIGSPHHPLAPCCRHASHGGTAGSGSRSSENERLVVAV